MQRQGLSIFPSFNLLCPTRGGHKQYSPGHRLNRCFLGVRALGVGQIRLFVGFLRGCIFLGRNIKVPP